MLKTSFQNFLPKAALVLCLGVLPLTGCDLANNQLKMDRSANMEMQDYRDALAPRIPDVHDDITSNDPGIPDMQPYIADPSDKLKAMPLVSISVNQTIPLRDALFELAEQADYDMELDPRIRGSIIFTARNKPFDVVVDRIADIAGLRYKFEDDMLRVELDTPYHEVYKITYLSYIRSNSGAISNNISVVSGDGADTGSRYQVTSESEADFWGELEANLTQILGAESASTTLRTQNDPRITAVAENPAPVEPLILNEDGEITVPQGSQQPPNAVLRVDSLPTDDVTPVSAGGTQDGENPNPFNPQFSVNRQAGIVSVFASERLHGEIQDYLTLLEKSVTSQVLIEAKVLEVSLGDEFGAGIDWRALADGLTGLEFGFQSVNTNGGARPLFTQPITPTSDMFLRYNGDDFSTAIDAISRFGTVHALASPRMTVLNNQSAVLNVATNRVYFELDVETTFNDTGAISNREIDGEIRNVPEGVLINVQPAIDMTEKSVAMAVRPTVTRIVSTVPDPVAAFNGVTNNIPVVSVQEVDTVIKVGSGEAVVIGGLMQDRTESGQNAVPVLGELPIFGAAFRNHQDNVSKTELVIFLRATIVEGPDTVHDTDKDLYKTFSQDRRPLRF